MTAVIPDIEIIQDLDFDYEPPCEYRRGHPGEELPADYVIRSVCPQCKHNPCTILVCDVCWTGAGERILECQCGARRTRDVFWKIIGVVR